MKLTELIDYIDRIPSSTLLVGMIVLGVVVGWFLSNRKDIKDLWDSWYKNRKRKDELLNMLLNDHDRIGKYEDNRKQDREQSFEIQKQLVDAQSKLAEQISEISNKIDENQKKTDERFLQSEEKNNKRVRAELKNEISEIYRRHHRTGKISSMALEVLENLIEEYESADGDNSFVHSVVQKEMYSWECLDDID